MAGIVLGVTPFDDSGASDTSVITAMPAVVDHEDLLIQFVHATVAVTGLVAASGWTKVANNSATANGIAVLARIANGDEGGTTVTHTNGLAGLFMGWTYRIQAGTYGRNVALATLIQTAFAQSGSAGQPDPPVLAPAAGKLDYLWLVAGQVQHSSATLTSPPSGYGNQASQGNASMARQMATARRSAAVASEDPGAFTFSATSAWAAVTVLVGPFGPKYDATLDVAKLGQSVLGSFFGYAAMRGESSLAASGTVTAAAVLGQATFVGQGVMSPAGTRLIAVFGAATIAGTSALAAGSSVIKPAQASIQGQGTVSGAGLVERLAQALFAGVGAFLGTAKVELGGRLVVTGQGQLLGTASILGTVLGQVTFQGLGILVAAGSSVTKPGQALIQGAGTLSGASTIERPGQARFDGVAAFQGASTIDRLGRLVATGTSTWAATAFVHLGGQVTFQGTGVLTPKAAMVYAARLVIAGSGAVLPNGTMILKGRVTIVGIGQMFALGVRVQEMPPRRIRVDVYDVTGTTLVGDGPVMEITQANYVQELGRIGSFSLQMPAAGDRSDLFTPGRECRIYREGEGLVFRGLVGRSETVARDGQETIMVQGSSITRRLVWKNTLRGFQFQGATPATIVAALVAGTPFTAGTIGSFPNLVTLRADAAGRWTGFEGLSKVTGFLLREDVLDAQVDVAPLGADTGITLRNVTEAAYTMRTNDAVIPLAGVAIVDDSDDLWNRIYPLGAGEVISALDLRFSDRASPYTRQMVTGPDMDEWFIEDAASVAAYGLREKYIQVKEAIPLAATAPAFLAAGNALYDVAAATLGLWKDPLTTYTVQIPATKHLNAAGAYRFQVGDKVRLAFRGLAHRPDGTEVYRDVNALLWLMGYSRTFRSDGSDSWAWKVATTPRSERDQIEELSDALSDLHTLQVSPKPYTYLDTHGPFRQSTDATRFLELPVTYQQHVFLLHRALLYATRHQVISNVQGMADGGGSTPTSGASSTSSSGASSASSSGASSSSTSGGGGSHRHLMLEFDSAGPFGPYATGTGTLHNHASATTDSGGGAGGAHAHTVSGGSGSESGHTHTMGGFTVNWTAQTPGGGNYSWGVFMFAYTTNSDVYTRETVADHTHGMAHTHGIAHTHQIDHTHTVTIPAHNHAVTYGIFQGGTIGNISRIDINGTNRTTALGGPWAANIVDLDITAFLQADAVTGQPLRQVNTVRVYSAALQDLVVSVKSLVTSASLVPV